MKTKFIVIALFLCLVMQCFAGDTYKAEHMGVAYEIGRSASGELYATPIGYSGGVAHMLPESRDVIVDGYNVRHLYERDSLAKMTGHATLLEVPHLNVSWLQSRAPTPNFLFWGVTNVDAIVISDAIVQYTTGPMYMEKGVTYRAYNLEGKLFRGCRVFEFLAFGGDVPRLSYTENGDEKTDVAMDTIQDILWHTEEFYYPAQYSNSWENAIGRLSYKGKYGAYSGEVFSRENIILDSGNLKPIEPPVITNYVYVTVTNEVFHYSTVTNEIHHYTTVTNVVKYVPEPGTSPDAGYGIKMGESAGLVIAGAAGWDAFGVPDGMEWDKETGTLSGQAKLSGTYDVMFVSGSGADTQIMRTTITVAPFEKIVGYVGVAFSQGGAPLNMLKSYKTLPAGLKWVSGGRGATALPGVLQGVPTKAQTLNLETVDGEPVTIEIRKLPTEIVGAFNGALCCGRGATALPVGRVALTVSAAGKISGKIYEGGRTWTLSAANFSVDSVATNGEFRASGTATRTANNKTYKQAWTLEIDGHAGLSAEASAEVGRVTLPGMVVATGAFGDAMVFEAQRNFWKDDGASELLDGWTGEYAWVEPDGGKLTLALDAAGSVKVTGTLANGRAVSLSTPLVYGEEERTVLVYLPPQTVKVKSGNKTVSKKCPEFIAVVRLANEPGMAVAGGDTAYRYR